MVAIIRGVASHKLIPMAEALYKGGIRLLEITYSANGSTPDSETAANIKALAEHFEGRMFIGAGTVLTEKQVEVKEEEKAKKIHDKGKTLMEGFMLRHNKKFEGK